MTFLIRNDNKPSKFKTLEEFMHSNLNLEEKVKELPYFMTKKNAVRVALKAAKISLPLFEKAYPKDNRPRKAIEATEAWLLNPCEKTKQAAIAATAAAIATTYTVMATYAAAAATNAAVAVANAAVANAAAAKTAVYTATYASYAIDAAYTAVDDARKKVYEKLYRYGIDLLKKQTLLDLHEDGIIDGLRVCELTGK